MIMNDVHLFSVDDAVKFGVNKAILLHNLKFWILKNKANQKHLYNGYYWTYNSTSAFEEIFPYMSSKSIGRWLRELEDDGIIKSANLNENPYDRTKWYTVPELFLDKMGTCIAQNEQCTLPKMSNVPITDINTDVNILSAHCSNQENDLSSRELGNLYQNMKIQYDLGYEKLKARKSVFGTLDNYLDWQKFFLYVEAKYSWVWSAKSFITPVELAELKKHGFDSKNCDWIMANIKKELNHQSSLFTLILKAVKPDFIGLATLIFPDETLGISDVYVQKVAEAYTRLRGVRLDRKTIMDWWEAFKVINLDGRGYNGVNDVYRHFLNWCKNQKPPKIAIEDEIKHSQIEAHEKRKTRELEERRLKQERINKLRGESASTSTRPRGVDTGGDIDGEK